MKKLSLVTWAVLLFCFSNTVNAQLALTNGTATQTIDFSSSISGVSNGAFTAAGFQGTPTAGQLNSNAWAVTGWSDGNLAFGGTQTTASTDYTRGATGAAQTTGGFYAATMSPHSASNPALLVQPGGSDFSPGTLTLKIVNNGTTNITQLDVSYKLYVRNDQGRSSSFNFSHSADNSTYTPVAALDYTSPTTADVLGYGLVGTKSTSITGLSIAPSSVYYIRWSSADVGGSGSRDEIGLDDITATATFSAAATPASDVSAAAGGEPTSISSLFNTQGASSSNFNFTVTDDAVGNDALPTLISQIVINQGTGNDIADWTQVLAGAELSDGTNSQTGTVAATSITFSGINTLLLGNILDGATKTFTLKVWLKTSLGGSLPTTVDGLNLAFKVQGSSFTTVAVTSTAMSSPGTTVESGSANNAVDVTATALNFTTAFAPTSINVFTNFTTPGVVRAQDANGNTDLGVTSAVTVTNSAGYSTINNPGSFTAGVLNFPANFQFGTGGGSTTVTVDDANAGTTNATSASITVTVPTPTLATSVLIPNFICPGSTVSVPYTATNFGAGNVFTAQLSDASGSFASPVSIGTITSTASGTISATIPANTANGTGYRIRVVGSTPSFTGTDNGQNITIQYSNSTPLFTESMGTVGANTGIATHETNNGFDNDGFTMSGSGDIRTSTPSTGYTGASGTGNVFLTNTAGTNFRIDGINTLGLSPMVLYMGVYKSTTGETGTNLQLEVSSNGGTSWTTIPWTTLAGTLPGTATWNQVKVTGALPQSATVSLRFTNLSNSVQFRLDDINVYSGTPTTFSVSPTGPIVQCGGTVALSASPAGQSYSWSNSQTTQSISVGSSGNYTVTITDAFGCSAANGPVSVTINTATLPTIKITSANNPVCAGVAQSFSVGATTDGGGSPSYQWKLNGTNVATGATYAPASLNVYDVVTCEMTSSATCVSPATVMSNAFTARPTVNGTALAFTENFGSSGTNVDFAVYTSATNPTLTFSGLGDVRNSTSSTGYTGASGASNAFLTQNGSSPIGEKNLIISNINTTNAFPNKLSFGMNKNTNADNGNDLLVEYSLDGISYFSIGTVTVPTGTGTGGTAWHLVTFDNALPYGTNVRLRFRNVTPTTVQYRVDDVTLTKYLPFTASVTPSGPTTFCSGGSVTLTAAPSGFTYLWSNASTSINIAATSNGTYTVSVTDAVGCKTSASQAVTVNALPSLSPSASPSTICNGASTTLAANATAGSGTISTYAWSSGLAGNVSGGSVSPTSNTTYDVTVTNSNSCSASGSVAVTVNNCGVNTWLGNTTQWTAPTNWSSGFAPSTCAHDALIPTSPSGGLFPTIGLVSVQVGDLTIQDGATITVNNNPLSVCGNLTAGTATSATITGNAAGSLVLNGSSNQQLSGKLQVNTLRLNNSTGASLQAGASYDVMTAVELENGVLNTTGATLRFRSTSATQIAVLDDFSAGFGGSINGPITAERAYNSAAYQDAHYFGSPVDGPTAGNLGSANGSSGFVTAMGNCDETQLANNSLYGNVYTYDETNGASCNVAGWKVEASGNPLTAAKGYSVRKVGAGTLVLSGTPHTDPIYLQTGTNSNWSNVSLQGRPTVSGWTMISNPFLATLDLTSTPNPAGYDVVHAVWNATGTFAGTYTDEDIIAPFQAFFVRRKTTGSPAYPILKNNLSRSASTTFQQQNNAETMTLYVTNTANGLKDKTTIGFSTDATNQYDSDRDAYKMPGALTRHTLYSYNSNPQEWLMRNFNTSIVQTSTVNVGFEPGANGSYSMNFDGLQSFDPTSYITLEDKKLNVFHDVRSGDYSFTATTNDNWNRFVLHFTPAAKVNSQNATCAAQGQITIEQPGSANWSYTVTNSTNTVISSGSLNQSNPVTVSAAAGVYTITLVDNNNYTVVKNLQITGASPIAATMTASSMSAETGEEINFTSTTANAATTEWNFGDGITATTVNASHSYTTEGTYNVSLTVTNVDGCSSTTNQMVTVTAKSATGINNLTDGKLAIWSNTNRVYVDFSKQKVSDATIDIYNILGQKVSSEKWGKSSIYSRELNNLDAGYVIVSVKTELGISTKKVFITGSK